MSRVNHGLLAAGLLIGSQIAAQAQGLPSATTAPNNPASAVEEDLPVMERHRPEYDAKGIPAGSFRLFPQLRTSASYDDNVFRTETGKVHDFFFNVSPSLRLASQWAEDALELYGGISSDNYAKQSQENLTDWNAGVDGRVRVMGDTSVYLGASAGEYHEFLSSPNTVGFQAAPNRFFQYHAEGAVTFQPNRLALTLGGIFDRYTFQDTPLVGGGTLSNKDRSYLEGQGYAKASYEFSPGYSAFLRGSYDTRGYRLALDRSGVHRSSTGYHVDGGLELQLSHLVNGNIYAGYLSQSFAAPLPDVHGLDYGVQLNWLVSPLLTLHVNGARKLNQTTFAGASVEDDKSIGLAADYELLRNVIIQAHGNYVDTSYPGIARHDESPDLGLNVLWMLDEYMQLNFGYTYSERATNASGSRFQDNLFTIGLGLHD